MYDFRLNYYGVVSIRPFYTMNILNGVKKWEIRKNRVEEGTIMLIYATKGHKNGRDWLFKEANFHQGMTEPYFLDKYGYEHGDYANRFLCGKLVGYFIVGKVIKMEYKKHYLNGRLANEGYFLKRKELFLNQKTTCLTLDELIQYGQKKTLYAWEITNLHIFDTPKPLSSVGLTNPPQSYCYINREQVKIDRL